MGDDATLIDIADVAGQHGDAMLRMSFLYLGDFHLAQDAVQDTLIKVYASRADFKGQSSVKTWVMRILINICKNYRRSAWFRRTDAASALEALPAPQPDPEDDAILQGIMRLKPKYKEVILLHYYEDLKIREIAEVLHCPESTVSVRLKRARDLLKPVLKGELFDE